MGPGGTRVTSFDPARGQNQAVTHWCGGCRGLGGGVPRGGPPAPPPGPAVSRSAGGPDAEDAAAAGGVSGGRSAGRAPGPTCRGSSAGGGACVCTPEAPGPRCRWTGGLGGGIAMVTTTGTNPGYHHGHRMQ